VCLCVRIAYRKYCMCHICIYSSLHLIYNICMLSNEKYTSYACAYKNMYSQYEMCSECEGSDDLFVSVEYWCVMQVYKFIHIHIYVCIYIYVHMYICIYIYICMYVCVYSYIYVYMCIVIACRCTFRGVCR